MKKLGVTLVLVTLIGIMAGPLYAYRSGCEKGGAGYGPGSGRCWSQGGRQDNLTDEQRAALRKLEDSFFTDSQNLRTDIWAKADELDAILRGSAPDAKRAKALQKEVSELKTKMAESRTDFILDAKKIDPNAAYGRRGCGRGMGKDMPGCNGPRRWKGPGSCWE